MVLKEHVGDAAGMTSAVKVKIYCYCSLGFDL